MNLAITMTASCCGKGLSALTTGDGIRSGLSGFAELPEVLETMGRRRNVYEWKTAAVWS